MMESTIRENTRYQILTPSGWSDFEGIRRKKADKLVEYKGLRCTPDHKIKLNDTFIEAGVLSDIVKANEYVYDPINVKKYNEYYSNDLISHNCEFQGSSGTLIAGWKLKELVSQDPLHRGSDIRKYAEPIKGRVYAMSVDCSEGKGLDHSAFTVIDITEMPYRQVCSFNSNMISPAEFTQIIHSTAVAYNEASVLIEYENMGPLVADLLFRDFEYENVLRSESAGAKGKRITSRAAGNGVDNGIKMTVGVKATGCSLLKLLIEQNQLIINDKGFIEELKRFSRKANTYCAEEGFNDDMAMTLVVFAWLTGQDYFRNLTDINTLAKLREKTEQQIEEELLPFGFISTGLEDLPIELRYPNEGWLILAEDEMPANF